MSSFGGKMREYTNVSIDRFDGENLESTVYFLSHCHEDHMQGLSSGNLLYHFESNRDIVLYCSEITKVILLTNPKYSCLEKFLKCLPVEEAVKINIPDPNTGKQTQCVTVTLLPAAHMPGSVMFLFEGEEGTVLYTGDFRLERGGVRRLSALHYGDRVKTIKSLYIDTTFCMPQAYHIPSRQQCHDAVVSLTREWICRGADHMVIIQVRAQYGHESVYEVLSEALSQRVHVSNRKLRLYEQLPQLAPYVTGDSSSTQIHACSWQGILSFLSAPLIGALSDVWGRKPFLLLTVTFTCAPIPLMKFSPWWYFAVISISGVFAVTFSVVFAYVADVTTEEDRSAAYGLVSATFAASLVTSPAIGAYLGKLYSENLVIAFASAITLMDIFFIMVAVPESLPERLRPATWGSQISWEKADPFSSLKRMGQDQLILMLCVTVFLSYLPEAGEYSCFFVYLRLVMNFSAEDVASFIAVVGVLSVLAQTAVLALLMKYLGNKQAILVGLTFEMLQLAWYGFGSQPWMMWSAGALAAMGSFTYPAISSFTSAHAEADQQGVAQGLITGMRGLCNGLGPALYGFIFYLFNVDLNENDHKKVEVSSNSSIRMQLHQISETIMPGPPFAFGSVLVILALLVAIFIPENPHTIMPRSPLRRNAPSPVDRGDTGIRIHESEPLISGAEST